MFRYVSPETFLGFSFAPFAVAVGNETILCDSCKIHAGQAIKLQVYQHAYAVFGTLILNGILAAMQLRPCRALQLHSLHRTAGMQAKPVSLTTQPFLIRAVLLQPRGRDDTEASVNDLTDFSCCSMWPESCDEVWYVPPCIWYANTVPLVHSTGWSTRTICCKGTL